MYLKEAVAKEFYHMQDTADILTPKAALTPLYFE
jgi:hypothetical protein